MSSWPSPRSTRIGAFSAYAVHLREAVPHDRGVARDPLVVPAHGLLADVLRASCVERHAARRGSPPAAASSEPSGGLGSAWANDSSDTESKGTTWRWTWGTSSPTIITPMRRASNAAICALPMVCATRKRCVASVGVEIDPVVDLGAGHHQGVTGVHRVDREEHDALGRRSTRTRRGAPLDDAGEQRRHAGRLPSRQPSAFGVVNPRHARVCHAKPWARDQWGKGQCGPARRESAWAPARRAAGDDRREREQRRRDQHDRPAGGERPLARREQAQHRRHHAHRRPRRSACRGTNGPAAGWSPPAAP